MRRFLPLLALFALVLSACSLGQPKDATDVTHDSATLNGTVSSNQSGDVLFWFEWGTTTELGNTTPDRTITFPEGHTSNDPAQDVSEPLTGLQPNTTYHYRICTSPGAQPGSRGCVNQIKSFRTEGRLVDSTVSDFAAGTPGSDTYVGATGTGDDGEVVLRPTLAEEFDGTTLPAGWTSSAWEGGAGSVTFADGKATIDGALLRTLGAFTPGRSLEFTGSFSTDTFQHLGFGVDFNLDAAWAIFSTGNGPGFLARTNGPAPQDTALGGSVTDPHRYRIEWSTNQVKFFVDGESVATHDVSIGEMRVAGSDFTPEGGAATWHWARLSPYATEGTFISRVLDSGQAGSDWTTLEASLASTPTGTQTVIETRSGDTATPDDTWSAWEAVGEGGPIASPDARYLQYRAVLSTSNTIATPGLERVTVGFAS